MDLFLDQTPELAHVMTGDDWYTPPEIFTAMGLRFDLDVCAPIGGVPWIPADRHYSLIDDCLQQPWTGRVWMNPPYSNPSPFVERFLAHGNGVCLVPFSKSNWCLSIWRSSCRIVFLNPNLKFVRKGCRQSIFFQVFLVAIGDPSNTEAIARLGRVR